MDGITMKHVIGRSGHDPFPAAVDAAGFGARMARGGTRFLRLATGYL